MIAALGRDGAPAGSAGLAGEGIVDLLLGAVVVKHDAVERQVLGQHTPGCAGSEYVDVEDGVDYFPAVVFGWLPALWARPPTSRG